MKKSVTMDTTQNKPNKPIVYTDQDGHDATDLSVHSGDVVCWRAKTSGNHHHLSVIFVDDTPFVDSNNNEIWEFSGSDADESHGCIGATISPTAGGSYKYCVGVHDDDASSSHSDDPTIKVGGGNAAIAYLNAAIADLNRAVELDPALETQIDPIEENLNQIIGDLSKTSN